jgi:hypothetical protein
MVHTGGTGVVTVPFGKTWQTLNAGESFLSAVCGQSLTTFAGIWGTNSGAGDGVAGEGKNGVHGASSSASDSGVWGNNNGHGYGVSGSTNSTYQPGSGGTAGVWGNNAGTGIGVKGTSAGGDGVVGYSSSTSHAGVSAVNDSGGSTAFGLWARGTPAGHFEGPVEMNGHLNVSGDQWVQGTITAATDIVLSGGQDCAEEFDLATPSAIEPGTVMVFDGEGGLKPSEYAYDTRVAGVVSGAGDYKPALILDKRSPSAKRIALGLVGKVFCKVDAGYGPVDVGDLLTTSPTVGHAMRASDPVAAFGAVLGKAMKPLPAGCGLVPVLIGLR